MNEYIQVLKKYWLFTGRATRKEYWMFFLVNLIIALLLGVLTSRETYKTIQALYALAVFCPSLGVTVRRLHDINKSGSWIFINLIPIVGWIIVLVLLAKEGQPGENQYGPNPIAAKVRLNL